MSKKGNKGKDEWADNNEEEVKTTLADFILPEKVAAFSRQFEPIDHWTEDCEMFNDARLREYFKAIVCPLGDPLMLYLQELGYFGFKMRHDESGEPVIYCKVRY